MAISFTVSPERLSSRAVSGKKAPRVSGGCGCGLVTGLKRLPQFGIEFLRSSEFGIAHRADLRNCLVGHVANVNKQIRDCDEVV